MTDKSKWCHVSWNTTGHRELFKIAAARRFCERNLAESCQGLGWWPDSVAVTPSGIQLLVRVPAHLDRRLVVAHLKAAATRAARASGVVPPWRKNLWDQGYWCSVLCNQLALQAVRRYLQGSGRGCPAPGVTVPGLSI